MNPITSSPVITTLEPRFLGILPSEPLVSVLVCNYNYEAFLGQTIESVLNQSYQNWELVICDDGSTDGSVPLIEGYVQRDRRIQLLRKSNGGHTSALNAAFSRCRGEIVCLLDSDDLFLPTKLEKVVAACKSNPELGLIVHRIIRVNKQRRRQGVWPLSVLPDGWFGPDLLRTGGIMPYMPPTSGISLRREIADSLFPLSTRLKCPDQAIIRLAPLITWVKRIPEALAEYRLHDGNTYSRQRVTIQSVTRELEGSKTLWEEQYRFLSGISPDLAGQLTVLESSSDVALLEYLRARLEHDPAARKYHAEYIAACKNQGKLKLLFFWRLSIYIPDILFGPAINVLLGQGVIKQLVARIRQLY